MPRQAIEPENPQWWGALGVAERSATQYRAGHCRASSRPLSFRLTMGFAELGLALGEAGAIEESREILARLNPESGHAERMRWALAFHYPRYIRPNRRSMSNANDFRAALTSSQRRWRWRRQPKAVRL
jgi:hypothetical protein